MRMCVRWIGIGFEGEEDVDMPEKEGDEQE